MVHVGWRAGRLFRRPDSRHVFRFCGLIVGVFALWLALPAVADDTSASAADHWAFQPIRRPVVPTVGDGTDNSAVVRNAIDAFVYRRLRAEGLAPSPETDRATYLRRLSLDLRGLPPGPTEVDSYRGDMSPQATQRVVERFLTSPQFGERWGRHWLDIARYADSEGNEGDHSRPLWTYRDWVVDALNRNLPFDRFVTEQLAADLLPNPTREQLVATGFHRNSVGGGNTHPMVVIDRVNATGTAFLGLTIACAQCHDHKFDPISQKDYYRLYAFFNNLQQKAKVEFASAEEIAYRDSILKRVGELKQDLAKYEKKLAETLPSWEASLTPDAMDQLKPEMRAILSVSADRRSNSQKKSLFDFFKEIDETYQARQEEIVEVSTTEPKFVTALVMKEREGVARNAHIFVRGVFDNKGETVKPGVPEAFAALPAKKQPADRTDLARWLLSRENPLTARVAVNRIWQRYFGVGLVETSDNFGLEGKAPSHPELLDWLASEFRDSGWNVKSLHRLIVTSSTYRQSSNMREEHKRLDPQNRLLARQARLRLEAEAIRDQALAVSGLLSLRMGGPGVFPHQVDGVMAGRSDKTPWKMGSGEDLYRRGLYVHFWRLTPHPVMKIFDAPSSVESCVRRHRSNTPIQALAGLNDPWFVECAIGLGQRLWKSPASGDDARLDLAFRLALARSPSVREQQVLKELLLGVRKSFSADPARAQRFCGSIEWARTDVPGGSDAVELAAWIEVSRALLNLDEFINRE